MNIYKDDFYSPLRLFATLQKDSWWHIEIKGGLRIWSGKVHSLYHHVRSPIIVCFYLAQERPESGCVRRLQRVLKYIFL